MTIETKEQIIDLNILKDFLISIVKSTQKIRESKMSAAKTTAVIVGSFFGTVGALVFSQIFVFEKKPIDCSRKFGDQIAENARKAFPHCSSEGSIDQLWRDVYSRSLKEHVSMSTAPLEEVRRF